MKLNLKLLFVVTSIMNLIPLAASAITIEDLFDAISSSRSCPVKEISDIE